MKTSATKAFSALMVIAIGVAFISISGCKKKDDVVNKTTYTLNQKDVIGVSGTVTFTEKSSTVTTIEISLTGVTTGTHPAHIHFNSAIETGGIALTLNDVDATGKSTTDVTKLNDGTAINYSQLITYDGYLNVHLGSGVDLATIIAQGDIGGNEILTTNKTYQLTTVNSSGIAGTALFEKRKNGNTLVTISIAGSGIVGHTFPAEILLGSVATVGGGTLKKTLNPVDGSTGKGYTNIRTLNDGTVISYDDWLVYDGYINVYQALVVNSIICQGDIGKH